MPDIRQTLRSLKSLAGPFPSFDPSSAPDDPVDLFNDWLAAAVEAGIQEAHAMTLSTVDADGRPDARVLILKNIDEHGWHFASSRTGPKGTHILANPYVALTFYWQPLGRQVRIRGTATDLGPEAGRDDFLARPESSRAGALLNRQSDLLGSNDELSEGLAAQRHRMALDPGVVAPNWALYAVRAQEVEFWQGDEERRHLRVRFRRVNDDWERERLWP